MRRRFALAYSSRSLFAALAPEGDDIADDPAALLGGSLEGVLAHFAGARIGLVSEFVGMGRSGELEVTPNQP
jgi:surfactin synthase thioesterase subunit